MNLTTERIRQIEAKALRKLQRLTPKPYDYVFRDENCAYRIVVLCHFTSKKMRA